MSIDPETKQSIDSRRAFFSKSVFGLGALALDCLLQRESALATPPGPGTRSVAKPLAARSRHFPAKAKSVIFLFMRGGPSHVDTFDPKPVLSRLDGQHLPPSFQSEDLVLQFVKASDMKLMGSERTFQRHGESGLEISDLFENVAQHADRLAVIRSCHHDSFIHGPALSVLQTGSISLGHPSMGAWVVYGLGSECDNLPGYMVMSESNRVSTKALYGPGFLPAAYQGTMVRTEGPPLRHLHPPSAITLAKQRRILDRVNRWNERYRAADRQDDSRLAARLANYELAFRMQMAAPELIDVSVESKSVRSLYDIDEEATQNSAGSASWRGA